MEGKKSKLKMPNNEEKNPSAVSPSLAPPWIELPDDVTANILRRLGAIGILVSAQKVCTTWRRVCRDPAMWRVIEFEDLDCVDERYDLTKMCRHAVDRSQGQVTDILLDHVGDDQLIHYIAQRSSHLTSLTLAHCCDMSGECLSEAASKLPQLEELYLIMMPCIIPEDIETIGISCPMLKSFTLVELGCGYKHMTGSEDDEIINGIDHNAYALAVAKTMPNLRDLVLFANDMKNEGLQALLDGCPHLESLDIRQCFGVDLRGVLGKRCSQQIKHLMRPSDSVDGCNWAACASCEGEDVSPDHFDLDDYINTIERFPDDEPRFFDHDWI